MFDRQKMWPDSVAQSDASLTSDQESRPVPQIYENYEQFSS